MIKKFTFLVFIILAFSVRSQTEIKITDPIPQNKAILVIPGITAQQLQSIKTEFAKYDEIVQSVYVYQNHNALLVTFSTTANIKFYSDLVKIIQGATTLSESDIKIKTSEAFKQIMPDGDDPNSHFIVK